MGKETVVLVVDDDHAVLDAMRLILERVSLFRVLCAIEAGDADRFFADREPIDVVIADVILAGNITGLDICYRAREIYPDVALVVISADPIAEKETMPDAGIYLPKPFGSQELLAAIGQARSLSDFGRPVCESA